VPNKDLNPILKILDGYKQAVYQKDVDSFSALYAENILVFDMWGSNWKYQGLPSWRGMAQEWFSSLNSERVDVSFEHIQLKQTTEMAYVSAFVKYTAVTEDGVVLRSLQNRMTCIIELINGTWKITHEHTSGPADPGTLKVSLSQ